MIDMYELLSDELAVEVADEVRNNLDNGEEMAESELDNIIWEKAMYVCKGDIDHYDVIDMTKAKIDCWDVIVPAGA